MNGMMKKIVVSGLLLTTYLVKADEPATYTDSGVLFVHGALRENTCRLEMDSAWQDVNLGNTLRADVNQPGKSAGPVTVKIYLRDCPEITTQSTNITPLTTTQSTLQPGYQAQFTARLEQNNPDLIAVTGASGIGLRLKDSRGQTVKLSDISNTLLLYPGQDEVTFTLAAERTAAPFIPGPFYALVNFSMFYQ